MKRNSILSCAKVMVYFAFSLGLSSPGNSQYLLKTGGTSGVYEEVTGTLKKIGLGTNDPSTDLHIYTNILNSSPFKLEVVSIDGNFPSPYGSLESFVTKNGQPYGIYQSHVSEVTLRNFLQGDLTVGRSTLWTDSRSKTSGLALDSNQSSFDFSLSAGTGPVVHPLSINIHGIRVTSKAVMDEFQLLTDPGQNKVLVSDSAGNGYWEFPADLSSEDDDWYFNKDRNLYANARMVGVGVTNPLQRFHCNGSLLVSDSASKLIFSDDSLNAKGDFTIEYTNNGLSFQNPDTPEKAKTDPNYHHLFLHDNGRTGIGTNFPRAKLEIDLNNAEDLQYGIILNQKSDTVKVNEIRFDMDDIEHWAIGYRYFRDTVDAFFIWNEYRKISSLFVEAATGFTGIETHTPAATLDVNGSFIAKRVGIGTDPPHPDSTWKLFVEGGIKAREIKVTVQPFADHVFAPGYPLLSIPDYERFIAEHRHLPGIPSEAEVEKSDGINLGAMQVQLLEKIEEQALYIVDLQRQISELKQILDQLKEDRP